MWPFTDSKKVVAAEREARRQAIIEKNTFNFNKGFTGVAVSGAAAVLAALMCKRSVVARRYRPGTFQANVLPPPFNPMKDAARAVADATVLASTLFAFGVASSFWVFGVGNLRELGQVLSTKYQQRRSTDPELANDKESQEITSYLAGILRPNNK